MILAAIVDLYILVTGRDQYIFGKLRNLCATNRQIFQKN